jgi:kynureninase
MIRRRRRAVCLRFIEYDFICYIFSKFEVIEVATKADVDVHNQFNIVAVASSSFASTWHIITLIVTRYETCSIHASYTVQSNSPIASND